MGIEGIREALRRRYASVADLPIGQLKYPIGRRSAERLGYRSEIVDRVPSRMTEHIGA